MTEELKARLAKLSPKEREATARTLMVWAEEIIGKQRPRRGRPPKQHPVPEWMDPKIAEQAKHMDVCARHEKAAELEKVALELRGMQSPEPVRTEKVTIWLLPIEAQALREYAAEHGSEDNTDDENLRYGARWVISQATTMLPEMSKRMNQFVRYRTAEGFSDAELERILTEKALAEFRRNKTGESDSGGEE